MEDSESKPIEAWVKAVESRDNRFDGWVIVGVTSTGIYCRPSCPTPVRPKPKNMKFFSTPAAAQGAGFRACKRCSPDSVPGSPEWNRRDDVAARAVRAIDEGEVDRVGVAGLARSLNLSQRHLNRIMASEIGATPLGLARARRARTALSLIRSTKLGMSEIAFASGFESVRQFNETIRSVFDQTPTQLRGRKSRSVTGDWLEIALSYREPYDFDAMLGWLSAHSVGAIEEVGDGLYRRSLSLPGGEAVVEVLDDSDNSALLGRFRLARLSDLPLAIVKIRRLFDLDADPRAINSTLGRDPILRPLVDQRPGQRVPGTVDLADCLFMAILHQQVSLASAVGTAERLVREVGTELVNPVGAVTHLFPTASTLSEVDPEDLAMTKSRANALVTTAGAVHSGDLVLSTFATDRSETLEQMMKIKGIGPWTAGVVALRGLADPDVVLTGDLALRAAARSVGIEGDTELVALADNWRPWRSYAMHHLWAQYASDFSKPPKPSKQTKAVS